MAPSPLLRRFARWHVWLGWLVGLPILMWTATGLFMVSRPIEEVRGTDLRIERPAQALALPGTPSADGPVKEMHAFMQRGRAISLVTLMDGAVRRVDLATGRALPEVDAVEARAIAAATIKGGDRVARVSRFAADRTPADFGQSIPVWQVALTDGTHVYIGAQTGEVEAVRTRWWRTFDVMWGLHIMDLKTREDTSHPILILFAALSMIGALLGCVLMFRRRGPSKDRGGDDPAQIARGLIDGTLPKAEWTHRAHFAAALWLLAHPEVLQREGGMAALIRRYNEATGVTNSDTSGYHETITLASLAGAAVHLAQRPGQSLAQALADLMAGPLGDKRWPFAYWSEELLMSPAARRDWVAPDKAPLPWPLVTLTGQPSEVAQ